MFCNSSKKLCEHYWVLNKVKMGNKKSSKKKGDKKIKTKKADKKSNKKKISLRNKIKGSTYYIVNINLDCIFSYNIFIGFVPALD